MSTDIEYMSTEIRSAREAITIFKILGIKNITTERQRKNGTTVYELPMQRVYLKTKYPIRFATYEAGYVRNVTEDNSSPYQINKTKQVPSSYGDRTNTERILIPKWEDRLIYLAKFIIKNYYRKSMNVISETSLEYIRRQLSKPSLPWGDSVLPDSTPIDDVQVIVNGYKYNLC